MSEVQKDPEDVFAGICKKNKYIKYLQVFLQFEVKVGKVNFDLAQSN